MRVHFVVPPEYVELAKEIGDLRVNGCFPYWVGGRFVWSAQSWLVLRQYREGFTFGTCVKPGVINFGHSAMWRSMRSRTGEFRVGVRADYPRLFDVDFEVLQNPAAHLSTRQAYLPYWPVPGLIERKPNRRGLRTIAYAGRIGPRNLADALKNSDWRNSVLKGLDFIIIHPNKWHDLSEIDLLLAVRSFDMRTYPEKPPSKLFNAWRASIPLVAGFDTAYSAVGRPNKDYIRVGSIQQFRQAVTQLREDTHYYEKIVEEGRKRASEVSHEKMALQWLEVFDHRIIPKYERWLQRGGPKRRPVAPAALDRARNLASSLKARLAARPIGP